VPFAPQDFHTFALWLSQHRTDEASLRTAISRAYYAGHLLAVQRLMQRGWEPKGTGDDHRGVIRALRRGKTRHLADRLALLLEFREHADYHLEATDTIRNQHCSLCKKMRESSLPDALVVNWHHWEEVQAVSQNLLSYLERI
jgi:hypothetical protein